MAGVAESHVLATRGYGVPTARAPASSSLFVFMTGSMGRTSDRGTVMKKVEVYDELSDILVILRMQDRLLYLPNEVETLIISEEPELGLGMSSMLSQCVKRLNRVRQHLDEVSLNGVKVPQIEVMS